MEVLSRQMTRSLGETYTQTERESVRYVTDNILEWRGEKSRR